MQFYREESLALFVVVCACLSGALLWGLLRRPELFAARDARPVSVMAAGAVEAPGRYRLSAGAAVRDAVPAARPLYTPEKTPGAGRRLCDGEAVYVPFPWERPAERARNREAAQKAFWRPARARRVDVNTADLRELVSLPGIGEASARAIMMERAIRPFDGPDDLLRVCGIGPRTLERLRGLLKE